MDKISVIIPTYNSEQFILNCLLSVINQSYQNLEIIIIDDGSTDSTINIISNLKKKDNRIFLYEKRHEGVSSSRNFGIKQSTGNFIFFVDSDDIIDNECILRLKEAIDINKCNLSICGYCNFVNEINLPSCNDTIEILNNSELITEICKCEKIQNFAWGKLYEKQLFENIEFPVGKIFEDVFTITKTLSKVSKCAYLNKPLYFYRKNPESLSNSLNLNKINDFFESMYLKSYFICMEYEKYLRYMSKSIFEVFYLLKKYKIKKRDIKFYQQLKVLYKKAIKKAPMKEKIKYLYAVI